MILVATGLLVGLTGAIGVWLFKKLIDLAYWVFFVLPEAYLGSYRWLVIFIPVLGGLIVGLLIHFFIGEERHHGVAGIMESAALGGGRLRYKRIPAKALAAALSIGSGASVGPEDPSVQIGANLGSMFGQKLHLSDDRMRALVAAGAASGIAAAFNAPIAGVFFSLEIILGEISGNAFGIVVLASVVSAVFTRAVAGPEPAFHVPAYSLGSPWELPLYLGLGLLAGPVAALYIRLLYLSQDFFHGLARVPRWLRPAVAGLVVGIVGVFLPQAMGVGYETIGAILNGEVTAFWLLAVLAFAKLILTPVSIGGGFPGGVFAPSLFIGAALGSAYGTVLHGLNTGLNIIPGAFAMVGMAALLAGAVHAPLTAVILLFEMTNDYRIILPLMFAVVVSMVFSQSLIHDSVYTLGLARKGIRLARGRDVEVLETITVSEVMQPAPLTLNDDESVDRAAEVLVETRHHGLPVLNASGELVGILTTQDVERMQDEDKCDHKIADVCVHDLLTAYSDETIGSALRRMAGRDIGHMPVVSPDNHKQMVGWLRRPDMLRAYDVALTRRAAQRHKIQQVRVGAYSSENMRVIEVPVERGAFSDGKLVKDIPWPPNCILISVRHRGAISMPNGNTLLKAGNILMAVVEGNVDEKVRALCKKSTPEKEASHAG